MNSPLLVKKFSTGFIFASFLILCGFSGVELTEIETAVIEKDFAAAEKLAETFIHSEPAADERNEAGYYLGLSRLYLGKYKEARDTFEDLLALNPTVRLNDQAKLGIIDSYYMAGDYAKALEGAQNLLKERPNSELLSLIYLKMARAYLRLTEWEEANRTLSKIIGSFPRSMEAHIAQQLLEEKQFFSVQIGSFLDHARATALSDELQAKGEYSYIVETTDSDGKHFYRVRIGQFASLDHAQDLKQKLASFGYPTRIYP